MSRTERLAPEAHETAAAVADAFQSILFPDGRHAPDGSDPDFFADLNLDQVVEAIIAGRDEYDLTPFFYVTLRDPDAIVYRQDVFRDFEHDDVSAAVCVFADEMKRMRNYLMLADKQHYNLEKQRWFIDAAAAYRHAVATLTAGLEELELASEGLRSLRDFVTGYGGSPRFRKLAADIDRVQSGLDQVRYTLRIREGRVTVSGYHDEADYMSEVEDTFARFREHSAESHLVTVPDPGSMDGVEARIVELLVRLDAAPFRALGEFCTQHRDFVDERVSRFDREAQFYLAYLQHRERLTRQGLAFCYPTVSTTSKDSSVEAGFDMALAGKLVPEGAPVVTNDFSLSSRERILVVTGPNQGGKTTFARMFAQLHYFAALGVPVPARSARLFLPDRVFTHFEREENIATLRGKLDDELVRIRDILERATPDSVVVINEIFASTTLADAVELGERVLQQIIERDCLALCVTFIDELTTLGQATVSMLATVEHDDPSRRTFKIVRKPADGRAYAWAIADKYGVSYERLKERLRQ